MNCQAQYQIMDLEDFNGHRITGVYYKDLQNFLDPFVGTYLYTNGNKSLKIVLQKKIMSKPSDNSYAEDMIVGAYQYIVDGQEKSNTLNRLNMVESSGDRYPISGNSEIIEGDPGWIGFLPGEKGLNLGLSENFTHNWAVIFVRKTVVNGQQAIVAEILWQMQTGEVGKPKPLRASFPGGEYTLIKQP